MSIRPLPKSCLVCTSGGRILDIMKPNILDINIVDIANSLSRQCRFNGNTNRFYSVCQHSILVSNIINPVFAVEGLLHDSTEAYIGDIVSPIKSFLPEFQKIESILWKSICRKYGLSTSKFCEIEIKKADIKALVTESRDFKCPLTYKQYQIEPLKKKIVPLSAKKSRDKFIERFYELMWKFKKYE